MPMAEKWAVVLAQTQQTLIEKLIVEKQTRWKFSELHNSGDDKKNNDIATMQSRIYRLMSHHSQAMLTNSRWYFWCVGFL